MNAVHYIEVGPDGERVDKRDYVTEWEKAVVQGATADPIIAKIKAGESLSEQEEEQLAQHLNQPQHYFNEDNLRRAYRNPGGNLLDFIKAALGLVKIKSREERVEENFRAWLVAKNLTPEQAQYLVAHQESRVWSRARFLLTTSLRRRFPFSTPPTSALNSSASKDCAT